jgi:ketosteroid isomerase-like protein
MMSRAAVANGAAITASGSEAEAFVRAFESGWNRPGSAEEAAARFEPWLDPGTRLIQPQMPDLVGHAEVRSGFFRPLFALLPDAHASVERWAARGDTVYIELTMGGTLGGRPVNFRACDRVRLRDGVAIEREAYTDPIPLLATIARRPRAWPAFARYQLALMRHRQSTKRANHVRRAT